MKKTIIALMVATLLSTMTGCTVNVQPANVDGSQVKADDQNKKIVQKNSNSNDGDILNISDSSVKKEEDKKGIRDKFIKQTYYTVAFQKEVVSEYKLILNKLDPLNKTLDAIFNFKVLMYKDKMLPPVIQQSENYYGKLSEKSLVKTEKRWLIIKDARVAINPPTWRDYLFKGIKGNTNIVNPDLKLKNDKEVAFAKETERKASVDAKEYVKNLLKLNLAKLKRDYIGMLTYKQLEIQGIVNAPVLAVADEPYVLRDNNREALIGAKRYLITYDSKFNNYKQWKPVVSVQKINLPEKLFTPPSYNDLKTENK